MNRTLTVIGILILFISCKSTNSIISSKSTNSIIFDKNVFWYDNLSPDEMVRIENRLNSKDLSDESQTVGFGISLYPNEKKFELEKPKTFIRNLEGELPLQVFYQFSNDNINRLTLYEWNVKDSLYGETLSNQDKRKLREKCLLKFDEIFRIVTSELGEPKENTTSESNRREVSWKNKNGMNAFLISFGPSLIRLSLYKE